MNAKQLFKMNFQKRMECSEDMTEAEFENAKQFARLSVDFLIGSCANGWNCTFDIGFNRQIILPELQTPKEPPCVSRAALFIQSVQTHGSSCCRHDVRAKTLSNRTNGTDLVCIQSHT